MLLDLASGPLLERTHLSLRFAWSHLHTTIADPGDMRNPKKCMHSLDTTFKNNAPTPAQGAQRRRRVLSWLTNTMLLSVDAGMEKGRGR